VRIVELLSRISEVGVTLTCASDEDRLDAKPTSALTPELIAEITKNKEEIIKVMREDEEMRRTGIIQSERQVFEVAREYFGLIEDAGAVTHSPCSPADTEALRSPRSTTEARERVPRSERESR
jgi:hypothetical protein